MWHGEDYLSLGFLFGCKSKVAYVSDVSRFPAETEHRVSYLLLSLQHHFLHSLFHCCVLFSGDAIWDILGKLQSSIRKE